MEGRPRRHCPHLGLKHTKAIRFSSPTDEHRCYIFGDPLAIDVDQRDFCLSEGYVQCPRFTGAEPPPAVAGSSGGKVRDKGPARQRQPRSSSRGPSALTRFWQQLSPRDRILYLSLVIFLAVIMAAYGVIIGVVIPSRSRVKPTAVVVVSTTAVAPPTAGESPTAVVVAVTDTPRPTEAATIRPATREATTAPTEQPTATATRLIVVPTTVQAAATATREPTTTPVPPTDTEAPATVTPVVVPPTATFTPAPPPPTNPPSDTWSTLYFLGPNKAYYVPVTRRSDPTVGVARRAIEEMIAGPRGGDLLRTIPAGMGLNDIYIEGGTAYVDFDHSFESLGAGQIEALAVVLALTEFSTVQQVQFLVNGTPVGLPGSGDSGPVGHPGYVNYENPYGLDPIDAVALVLYFATPGGQHLFPVVRLVPMTLGTAQAAINEMIQGTSAAYQGLAVSPLPSNLAVQNIYREGDIVYVDFNGAFWGAANQDLAINALALAMTSLTADSPQGVVAVHITVDGAVVGTYYRPILNPE